MWKTGLICFILFFVFVFAIFGIKKYNELLPEERTAERMLKKTHEKDLLPLLEKYYDSILEFDSSDLYELDKEKNEYVLSQQFNSNVKPIIDEIKEFHCIHHNNEQIPRGSEEWKKWMGCSKTVRPDGESFIEAIEKRRNYGEKQLKNNFHITFCPYCLAIEEMKITDDSIPNFEDTYLSKASVYRKKFYKGLEIISREDQLRNLIKEELLPILNDDSMFSLNLNENTIYQYKVNSGDYYYINLTPEYENVINKIYRFHLANHKQIKENDFSNIWMHDKRLYENYMTPQRKTDWWDSDDKSDIFEDDNEFIKQIHQGNITSCPICILLDDIEHNRNNIASDGLAYKNMYTFSNMAVSRYYDYADEMDEIKNAVPITRIGDALKNDYEKAEKEWNHTNKIFYGTILDVEELDEWYDSYDRLRNEPAYRVEVKCESSWFSAKTASFTILKSKISNTTQFDLKEGREIYFKGYVNIDGDLSISITNRNTAEIGATYSLKITSVSIPKASRVEIMRKKRLAKEQKQEDDLVRAFANIFAGGTPLSASDFE